MTVSINPFYDAFTSSFTYVVYDTDSRDAVIIDPVLNFDPSTMTISKKGVTDVLAYIDAQALHLHLVLETHIHADHLSAGDAIRQMRGTPIGISNRIPEVQKHFCDLFNMHAHCHTDGSQFNILIENGATLKAGTLTFIARHIPGHTPACCAFFIEDAVFVADALFMPSLGTGRCDFPGGDANQLYRSVTEVIYTAPDITRIFLAHDYPKEGEAPRCETSVGASKQANVMLNGKTSLTEFTTKRMARDNTLQTPRLMTYAMQVNINAGRLPPSEENGTRYFKIPIGSQM